MNESVEGGLKSMGNTMPVRENPNKISLNVNLLYAANPLITISPIFY